MNSYIIARLVSFVEELKLALIEDASNRAMQNGKAPQLWRSLLSNKLVSLLDSDIFDMLTPGGEAIVEPAELSLASTTQGNWELCYNNFNLLARIKQGNQIIGDFGANPNSEKDAKFCVEAHNSYMVTLINYELNKKKWLAEKEVVIPSQKIASSMTTLKRVKTK